MTSRIILTFTVTLFVLSSCSKYDDGPTFSLFSKTDRVTNSWVYTEVYRNGLNITLGAEANNQKYTESTIGFADDGRFSFVDAYRDSTTINGDGYWEFVNDDESLQLTYDSSALIRTLKINRLERSYLWLEENLGNNNTLIIKLSSND
ncbi:MAG: hypothetical protein ACPG19_14095 [Saprospiraceae bacterium]